MVAELAVMVWLCSGLLTNRTNREHRLLEVVSLSDVSTQVWSGVGLQLAVLLFGVLAMVRPSTRAFGQPLSVIATFGSVLTICMFVYVYYVASFD